ncbi:acyltransferase family protein [Geodermatophilus normandii]|uniref:acyltransferase family protein n=1 Tax=Geodermatophilus normandii TaxID=1137989 RepID=UPI002482F946|nr:acyltransferase [Geodermatophilus normandii]
MQSHSAPRGEIRALTGLRLVAALWVLVYHLQAGIGAAAGRYLDPVMPVLRAGWLGVDLFFVLSGFVMALTYLDDMGPRFGRRATGRFLWARLCRVWPLWVLLTCLFAGWLLLSGRGVAGPVEEQRVVTPLALLEQVLMVQMWHRDSLWGSTFVLAGWSLSVEFLAYVCFPVLVLVVWRLRRLPVVLLASGAVGVMVPLAYLSFSTGMDNDVLPWQVRIGGAFVSGMLTCLVVRRIGGSATASRWSPLAASLCLVYVVFVCWWSATRSDQQLGDYSGVAALFFPVLVGALALAPRGLATLLSSDTAVVGGRISFALYLVHGCVFEITDDLFQRVPALQPGSPLWTLVQPGLVLVCLALSYGLWRGVEEPARRWLRRVGPGGRRAPARPPSDRFPPSPDRPPSRCPSGGRGRVRPA